MAINYPNFLAAPVQKSPFENLFENVLKGYEMQQKPAQMKEEQSARQLANKLREMEVEHKPKEYELNDKGKEFANALQNKANQYYEEKFRLDRDLKKAQTQKALSPGSAAAKANGKLANFMVSHPNASQEDITEFADKLSQAELKHLNQTTERSEALNRNQYKRDATTIVKKHIELKDIDSGKLPGTDVKISEDEQAELRNDLLLSLVKDVTDPKTREKLINASNMNITLDTIDPTALTQYSGAKGRINKLGDSIIESAGKGSEAYKDYRRETIKASAAAKQMRQYLGDSIQPTAQERLDHLTNPEAWNVSPQLAKENFEFIRDLYKRETQTLVRAATDPSLYTAKGNSENESHAGKTYDLATGKWK
jgi:hypothetical protein